MDDAGKELTAADIYAIFEREYGIGNAGASVVQPQMTEVAGGAMGCRVREGLSTR